MILDKTNLFSDSQTLTATGASTNVIDLGVARDIGKGVPIPMVIQVMADATGTSPTIKADIEVSDTEAFTVATVVASSEVLTSPVAGDQASIRFIPKGVNKRYVRIKYTLGGTSPSVVVTAGVVAGHQD